ncbi:hypothetical protein [Bosea sp. BIWAKO-01]|uniref:hypothetical protein n=1 Tax=Bosea sp. BIWAKO-01 TaxID=506668 RepID=UPI0008536125|nr:hypothetical protein [Bosea sp. BIWAKO-01]GAU85936.1 hypothetical protein BIWAKO_05884 [Bosea sp. BIWAKO-01]
MRLAWLEFGLVAAALWYSAAIAQEIPRIDIEKSCRQARALSAEDTDPYAGCVQDETGAQAQLPATWAAADGQQRQICAEQTRIAGSPSYVELLACLEMYAANSPAHSRPRRLQPRP